MKAIILVVCAFIVLGSCTERRQFNIKSVNPDFDTLEVTIAMDSFETQLKKIYFARVDTSDFDAAMHALTDSVGAQDWADEIRTLTTTVFRKVFTEFDKPNSVTRMNEETIHVTILSSRGYIELEVAPTIMLAQNMMGEIKSHRVDFLLWDRVRRECLCSVGDSLNAAILNYQGGNLCRLDIVRDKEYKYCWKEMRDDDVISQLVKMAGVDSIRMTN
jgi:hypothetical protein